MGNSIEEKILIFSAKLPFLEEDKKRIKSILLQKINWDLLINLAANSGIFPIISKNLLSIDDSAIFKAHLEELFNEYKIEYSLSDLALWGELKKIIRIAKEKQIPIIYFKGVVLKAMLYDNPGLRKTSDIDILIKKEFFPAMESALINLGYTLKPEEANNRDFVLNTHFHFMFEKKIPAGISIVLELHWDVVPYVMRINNLVEDFWRNAQERIILGEKILTLSLEDLVFASIIEVYKEITHDRFFLPKHHLDISQILQRFEKKINWDEFIQRTHSYRLDNLVYYVLSVNKKLFNSSLPGQEILDKIKPSLIKRILIHKFMQNLNYLEKDMSYQRYLFYLFFAEVILLGRFKVFLLKSLYLFYPQINFYKKNKRIKYILFTSLEFFYRLIIKNLKTMGSLKSGGSQNDYF